MWLTNIVCSNGIKGCKKCSGSSKCTECDIGYYKSGDICTPCEENCESCDQNTGICKQCSNDHYPNGKICDSCSEITNCTSCSQTAKECTSCKPNVSYLNENKSCSSCSTIENCIECSSGSTCTKCVTGYTISSGGCVPCSSIGCSNCSQSEYKCLSCDEGTTYNETTGLCSVCSNIDGKCLTCESNTCLTCMNGNYLDSNNCYECSTIDGCLSCSNSTKKCTVCKTGYYLNGDKCSKCDSGCYSCTGASKCTICNSGNTLVEGVCQCLFQLIIK